MSKQFGALLAAILITGAIVLSMFVVGANAMTNKNGTPVSNSPAAATAAASTSASSSLRVRPGPDRPIAGPGRPVPDARAAVSGCLEY